LSSTESAHNENLSLAETYF